MMKWLGLLLVVCSGGGIGFLYAMRLRQEPHQSGTALSDAGKSRCRSRSAV
ncbi:MAG: hypothetical protein ACLSFT_00720 [Ruminococcus callidus]